MDSDNFADNASQKNTQQGAQQTSTPSDVLEAGQTDNAGLYQVPAGLDATIPEPQQDEKEFIREVEEELRQAKEFTIPEELESEKPRSLTQSFAMSAKQNEKHNEKKDENVRQVQQAQQAQSKPAQKKPVQKEPKQDTQPKKSAVQEAPNLTGTYMHLGFDEEDDDLPKYEPKTIDDPSLSKYKVLIIEDNSDVRFQYEFILKKAGFSVITAKNGEEGIIKAIKEKPQLIILDILMPEMDGWEVLKVLRKYTATYRPKILVFSNLGAPEDKERAIELGADGFFIKADITLNQMVDIVKKHLVEDANGPKVFIVPLDLGDERVKKFFRAAQPEVRSGKCPDDGGDLGLKLIPNITTDEQTGKQVQEYNARIVCLVCGKEWV